MTYVVDRILQGRGTVLGTFTDDIEVLERAGVCSLDGVAVMMTMDDADLTIHGEVLGSTIGVSIEGNDATVRIGPMGSIGANSLQYYAHALEVMGGGLLVENDGHVIGFETGIRLLGGNGTVSTIVNRSVVIGNKVGIFRDVAGSGSVADTVVIANSGSLRGTEAAIAVHDWADARELVENRGHIYGDVALGLGADSYDGRGGTIEGRVLLGAGADRARPGAWRETMDGGAGTDTLDFRGSERLVLSLAEGRLNTGAARGDRFSGFENVVGTDGGDDLAGNGAGNHLSGEGGSDRLRAGDGADRLTGGAGHDVFVFTSRMGIDRVTDFSARAWGDDRVAIQRAAFGLDVSAGAALPEHFVVRADNRAQEADDLLIFRRTDRSLWVDADGSGPGAAVQVAIFEGATPLTAQDFGFV